MSVICRICNREFEKLISSTHLKSHGMTTKEYVDLYGKEALTSPEYRKSRSEQMSGSNNPNYNNRWTEEQKEQMSNMKIGKPLLAARKKRSNTENIKQAVMQRELKYNEGVLQRKTYERTDEVKAAISESVKKYAIENEHELKERAARAAKTKRDNIENGIVYRTNLGMKHTEETKERIRQKSIEHAFKKHTDSIESKKEFITAANLTYISHNRQWITIQCNNCKSIFKRTSQVFTNSKFTKELCRICYPVDVSRSAGEIELYEFVKSIHPSAVHNARGVIEYELDIYIPDLNLALEYDGIYWHSDRVLEAAGNSKLKSNEKRLQCAEKGIRLVTVCEDEWVMKNDIVRSRISNILGGTTNRIYARKCKIEEITKTTADDFCNANHIQGAASSSIRYGLFYNNELISVMTFSKSNISRKLLGWEINRFCSKLDCVVVGAADRLFKKFTSRTDIKIDTVVSYSDNRWSIGNLYKRLGFELSHESTPGYWYFEPNSLNRIHRYTLRKNVNDPKDKTEFQLRDEQGYIRVWDCGMTKWIWKRT